MKYDNNVYLIGEDLDLICKKLSLNKNDKKDWEIHPLKNNGKIEDNFNEITNSLETIISNSAYNNKIFSFTIIYSLGELSAIAKEKIKLLFDKIDEVIDSCYNLPFFIFLTKDEKSKNELDKYLDQEIIKKKINIDKRNISSFISPLNNDLKKIEKETNIKLIERKILTIFSYFFELGDDFTIDNKKYKLYDEFDENYYPINILILGKTQVGKSTFINNLLKEKRAKEGGDGSSVSKEQISYHINGIPLIVNDIEGFTGEENINKVVEKISKMQNNLNEKELHLVIYILDYGDKTYFNDNEYLIFKQLSKKLDSSNFLFICSKSKEVNNKKVIEKIRKSFYQMISKGLEKHSEKDNIMNILNYLYFCQKKDIKFEEIKTSIDEKEFNEKNFLEKLLIKFQNVDDTNKNKEMISTIIKEDETLIFTNLMKDEDHEKIFGLDKVSKQIRKVLEYIKEDNIKFIKDKQEINKRKIKELNLKIKIIKENLKENKEIIKFINNNEIINGINSINDDEEQSLLNEKKELENSNKDYIDLLNAINEKNIIKAKKNANILKKKLIESIEKSLRLHKAGAWISGIIPVGDIFIQMLIKKSAKKKIAEKFNDNLIDLNDINHLSEEEKKSLEEMKNKSDDKTSDILKTLIRCGTIAFNIFAKTISIAIGGIGIVVGMTTGGLVMNYDIKAYLDFYGKRLDYRLLLNLSFEKIEKYLKENFENKTELNK